jgi:hypothetical protein
MLTYTSKGVSHIPKVVLTLEISKKLSISSELVEESIKAMVSAANIGFLKQVIVPSSKMVVLKINRQQYKAMLEHAKHINLE